MNISKEKTKENLTLSLEDVIFDESSLQNPPNGKRRYRKKGLLHVPGLILYTMIIIYGILDNSIIYPIFILMFIPYIMIFYPVISYLFGFDELVIFENSIQLPEKSLKNIIRRTHNILPLREIKKIYKSSSYPTEFFTVFTIHDKKNRIWDIRKCFINDIDRLSNLLNHLSKNNNIEFLDYSEIVQQ